MLYFFTATSDDVLLIPSLLAIITALGVLTVRHFSQRGLALYLISCLFVIIGTLVCALLIHNRKRPIPSFHGRRSPTVLSGGFFALFPVGLLFAGESLYLAVVYIRDPNSYQFVLSSFTSSPIFLCLLSTTAAVICLWSRQQIDHSKKDNNDRVVTPLPFQASFPLFEEWKVQQRSAFFAALFASFLVPFLQLYPAAPSSSDFVPTLTVMTCAFVFAFSFFSVLGIVARTIVRMTNGSVLRYHTFFSHIR